MRVNYALLALRLKKHIKYTTIKLNSNELITL